ncbi:cyclic nucleotide-binding domain-containing protein [Macromonas nakdongensis]|uniref:cyclic nucleotide-binding domain-containing protein n=1 Tax=Macromonas nakdongensis TaxID=1843082 RepID=UPI0012FF2343|nr:cyclic nucleotide-binding domain-containing protein [Macromonas nakdongensis]
MHTLTPSAPVPCRADGVLFAAGAHGPLWRVLSGAVRLDRPGGAEPQLVQLALPGELIGVEALCEQPYAFNAVALTDAALVPVELGDDARRAALMREALLQQQHRSQHMAALRTGAVALRMAQLLALLGLDWRQAASQGWQRSADAIREALPPLRVLAQVVDAKAETVCRALAQLLPPRSKKTGPARLQLSAG